MSIHLHPPPSMSTYPLQLLQSALAVYLCHHIVPTIGLTSDQGQTCLDLVFTPSPQGLLPPHFAERLRPPVASQARAPPAPRPSSGPGSTPPPAPCCPASTSEAS